MYSYSLTVFQKEYSLKQTSVTLMVCFFGESSHFLFPVWDYYLGVDFWKLDY